ncbi:hypothetical protein J6590_089618 [Homalodisca vitripennis]|nr:hypothetical protein J6590_089618 [Homalodisca vitripennis]
MNYIRGDDRPSKKSLEGQLRGRLLHESLLRGVHTFARAGRMLCDYWRKGHIDTDFDYQPFTSRCIYASNNALL